jgi:hypothetical protein
LFGLPATSGPSETNLRDPAIHRKPQNFLSQQE